MSLQFLEVGEGGECAGCVRRGGEGPAILELVGLGKCGGELKVVIVEFLAMREC